MLCLFKPLFQRRLLKLYLYQWLKCSITSFQILYFRHWQYSTSRSGQYLDIFSILRSIGRFNNVNLWILLSVVRKQQSWELTYVQVPTFHSRSQQFVGSLETKYLVIRIKDKSVSRELMLGTTIQRPCFLWLRNEITQKCCSLFILFMEHIHCQQDKNMSPF